MSKMNHDSYSSEWKETMKTLSRYNANFRSFRYFLKLGEKRADPAQIAEIRPRVVMIGTTFPEEIVRALRVPFFNISGGSLSASSSGEPLTPRDTDAAVRHILGMLTDDTLALTEKSVILLPVTSDSMRKLPDLLGDRMTFIPYEVPNDKEDDIQIKQWIDEIRRVTSLLERHTKRLLTASALKRECDLTKQASEAFQDLIRVCHKSSSAISGSGCLWIADSYSWCMDPNEWIHQVNLLTAEIRNRNQTLSGVYPHNHILMIGSPVYAPNYKTPFLIEEMGLELYSCVHPAYTHLSERPSIKGNKAAIIRQLALQCLKTDMSPACVKNDLMEQCTIAELENGRINGVIAHILKGQIEYDFELNRIEPEIDRYQVPVFRLETDYNNQDVEQLRIRMEAFAEMLRHRANIQLEDNHVKDAI